MIATTGRSLIQVENVYQAFRSGFWMRKQTILEDVSLTIRKGNITGFLGANGAGKTTLIHLIVGIRHPLQGRVLLSGRPTVEAPSRAEIGYLPERPYFYEFLTGERILRYFAELSGIPYSRGKDRIREALEIVGLSDAGKRELRHYSKGMLQRIGIAQAIIHSPQLLVLDEPMSGLDPVGRRDMRQLIEKLRSEGRTIFFSTHVVSDVEAICDDVVVIEKGKILGQDQVEAIARRFGSLEGIFEKSEEDRRVSS